MEERLPDQHRHKDEQVARRHRCEHRLAPFALPHHLGSNHRHHHTAEGFTAVLLPQPAIVGVDTTTWVPRLVSTIFITVSILIFWAARRNSVKMMRRLNAHSAEPQTTARMTLIASILSVGAAATGLVLWFL